MHISIRTLQELQFPAKLINRSRILSQGIIDGRILSSLNYETSKFREIEPIL